MMRPKYLILIVAAPLLYLGLARLLPADDDSDATGRPDPIIVNSIGMKLALIPANKFHMGSLPLEKGRHHDERQHRVNLTEPFRIGVTEVTQSQWQAIMGFNRSYHRGDDLPAERLSWKDAVAFCDKLSENEGKIYRLPTEAQWEYACRAGAAGPFAGPGKINEVAWHYGNSKRQTHPVAAKKPNDWGLYDMHGNVAEWCSDYYAADYPDEPVTDPTGPPSGAARVVRGGAWDAFTPGCRSAARLSRSPAHQLKSTGFRVILDLSPDPLLTKPTHTSVRSN